LLFFSPNKFDNPADKLGNPVATQSGNFAKQEVKKWQIAGNRQIQKVLWQKQSD